jgi:hypothetical protein
MSKDITIMTKLNPTQRALLGAADADGVIEIGDGAKASAKALIKLGLAIWTPAGDGGRLIITAAGRAAISAVQEGAPAEPNASDGPAPAATPDAEPEALPPQTVTPAPKGKIAALVALLSRPEGVTVEVMMTATGWQAHSVRGAMSGAIKKTLGLTVLSEKTDGGRIYRIPANAGVEA